MHEGRKSCNLNPEFRRVCAEFNSGTRGFRELKMLRPGCLGGYLDVGGREGGVTRGWRNLHDEELMIWAVH